MNKHPNTKYNQINYDRSHSNADAPKPKDHRVTFITVVTDASFCPNTNVWGYGGYLRLGERVAPKWFKAGGISGANNSTDAERIALNDAIEHLINIKGPNVHGALKGCVVTLQCDNLDALESCNWKELKSKGYALNVSLKHIKGHTKNTSNRTKVHNICDELAGERMRAYRRKILQA